MEHSSIIQQPLANLVDDPTAWARVELDPDRVALFADLLDGDGDALPPIEVVELPDGRSLLAEGHQRVAAALARGMAALPAIRLPLPALLDPRDVAYDRSLETAIASAKPLSTAERHRAARRMLADHPGRPDREIGRRVGLSHQTIGRLRAALTGPMDQPTQVPPAAPAKTAYPATADELTDRLIRDLERLWEGRGFTDVLNERLARNLAGSLVERFGQDGALVWARRLAAWTNDAVARLAAS